ncbi:alpha-1-antichymotrypsin [Dasypus novemcinctus]|uniref:alpha-1-antichymotrypsin n=1 Tax=Dasypus novemcinctus TaxID=9361 RepID=UPI000328A19B|nr:alpha-1-antichymotrypsin [Dasypus novemcinctus]
MSPLLALGLLVAGFCPFVLCHPNSTLEGENLTQEDPSSGAGVDGLRVASSSTDFAFGLYRQLVSEAPDKNVIFSPLSVHTALGFLSLVARGTTQTELLEGLKFNLTETPEAEIHQGFQHLLQAFSQPRPALQLSMGNALFVSEAQKLLERFLEDARGLYASEAFTTNFQDTEAAKQLINSYVEKKTQGKIVDLMKNLESNTVMVLVNYIFFKAKWKDPFDPRGTLKTKFHVSKSKSVEVPMMNLDNLRTPYFRDEALACTLVELLYTGNASALFVLPDEGKMEAVEAALSPETLTRWRESLKMSLIDELYVPKFSISGDYSLEDVLPQLGVREVFTHQADLSGATGSRNLVVSQVVHKAVLDVAEVGTEAAAATGIKIIPLSGKLGPLTIVNLDRPFLMIIFDQDTQSIPFLSKVVNPRQA